jgi:hypothetical protein
MILHFEKLVSFALILERLSPLIEPHSKLGLRMQLGLNSRPRRSLSDNVPCGLQAA